MKKENLQRKEIALLPKEFKALEKEAQAQGRYLKVHIEIILRSYIANLKAAKK